MSGNEEKKKQTWQHRQTCAVKASALAPKYSFFLSLEVVFLSRRYSILEGAWASSLSLKRASFCVTIEKFEIFSSKICFFHASLLFCQCVCFWLTDFWSLSICLFFVCVYLFLVIAYVRQKHVHKQTHARTSILSHAYQRNVSPQWGPCAVSYFSCPLCISSFSRVCTS